MEGEPDGLLLRRRHVVEWLGVEARTVSKWMRCGLVQPVFLGGPQPFYLKTEIKKIIQEAKDERERVNQEN